MMDIITERLYALTEAMKEDSDLHNVFVNLYDGEQIVLTSRYTIKIGSQMSGEFMLVTTQTTPRRQRLVNRLKTAALCTARAAFGSSAPKTGLRMRRLLL